MSPMSSLSGRLPKGEQNGLASLEAAFVKNPMKPRPVLAIIDVAKIVDNVDTGEVEPQLRILRIESICPEDADLVEQLMRRAIETRVGMTQLPIDLEDEITAAFKNVDAIPEPPGPPSTDGQEPSGDDAA